jgi:hypothetical protein
MREVYERDGGCCTYVGPNGRRCRARAFVEFDHITPVALGGKSTTENLRLRCQAHNQLAARERFGEDFMAKRAVRRSDRVVLERAAEQREAWFRFLAPRGEEDLRTALRARRERAQKPGPCATELGPTEIGPPST